MKNILPTLWRYMWSRKKMVFYECTYDKHKDDQEVARLEDPALSILKPKDYAVFADLLVIQKNDEKLFEPTYSMGGVQRRIKNEEICIIYRHDNKIAGYLWVATRKEFIPEIQATVKLQPGEVYLYNCYIHKAYRRKGIATKLTAFSRTLLTSKKYKKEIVSRMAWNYQVKGVLGQMNYTASGNVIIIYFLGFRLSVSNCPKIILVQHGHLLEFYKKLFMKFFKAA